MARPVSESEAAKAADLIEKLCVIQQRAAQHHYIAHHHQRVCGFVGGVQMMLRSAHGEVAQDIQDRSDAKGPIQIGAFAVQPLGVTHRGDQVDGGRQ